MEFFKKVKLKDIILVSVGVLVGATVIARIPMSSDVIVGLLGVVVGAFIPAFFQSLGSRMDRRHQLRLAAIDKR